ncbi:MAG: tRNA pseudouridine(38-40) synthase TruA [Fusobacteriaceae bacterium]
MKNYMFTIQYDGSRYSGWQRLPELLEKTIQGKIEVLLSKILDEKIEIIGSGRTDAGVHALMQVANFKTSKVLEKNFIEQFNRYLPEDIRITSFQNVDDRFHSRYNAKLKTYMYRIDNSVFGDAFIRKFSYHVDKKLDLDLIKKATQIFLGEHDFTSFSKNSNKKSCVRTIEGIDIVVNGDIIEFFFTSDGFLYNMVRMIVGTLISVGLHQISLEEVASLLKEQSRTKHRFVAPPQGLFLHSVKY